LIVLCNKYDAWWKLVGQERLPNPWKTQPGRPAQLDMALVSKVSRAVRRLLNKYSPDLVSSAEAFSTRCFFLPASATGTAPELDPESGVFGIRPRNMNPMWCDVPLLVILADRAPLLIPDVKRQPQSNKTAGQGQAPS
jgi:hypothetical protein